MPDLTFCNLDICRAKGPPTLSQKIKLEWKLDCLYSFTIASPHRSYPLQLSMLSEAFFIHFLG